ncbi:protein of unknown function (plasmid) [Paraburkholderia kururiensis]
MLASVCPFTVTSPLPPSKPPVFVTAVVAVTVVAPSPALVSEPELLSMLAADTVAVPCAPLADIVPPAFDSAPPAVTARLPPVCAEPALLSKAPCVVAVSPVPP